MSSDNGPRRSARSTPSKYRKASEADTFTVTPAAAGVGGEDADTVEASKLLLLAGALLLGGTAGLLTLEPSVTGKPVDALYMTVATLTTIGYGDLVPTTLESKAFVVAMAICGLGLFGALLDTAAAWQQRVPLGPVGALAAVVGLGGAAFHLMEGWTLSDSLYFSVITSTSIGYGDHDAFAGDLGKLLLVAYALLSVGAMATVVNSLGDLVVARSPLPGGVVSLGAALIALGAGGLLALEPTVQTPVDAVYMAVITLTTVGYGDLFPTTLESKAFVVLLALLGLGLFSAVLDAAAGWKGTVPGGAGGLLVVSVGGGALAFSWLEGWALHEAAYFCVVTSTSIGYGDHPQLAGGDGAKLVLVGYCLLSMGVMGVITSAVGDTLTALCKTASSGKDRRDA